MTTELRETAAIYRHRDVAYALLRFMLGIIFLTTSLVKFSMGISTFAAGLAQQFAGKLPTFAVIAFGYVLPFVELTLGILLILGLFNVCIDVS